MIDRFNIRVYALCIKDQKVLALHEKYAGQFLTKLPGGGLEFGEGIIDCLHREFVEELNLKIKVVRHFYTQEDFLTSRFRENEQLITIYYLVDILNLEDIKIGDTDVQSYDWYDLSGENPFPLPIDKLVFEKAQKELL